MNDPKTPSVESNDNAEFDDDDFVEAEFDDDDDFEEDDWEGDDGFLSPEQMVDQIAEGKAEAKDEVSTSSRMVVQEHFAGCKHQGSGAASSRLMEELAYFHSHGMLKGASKSSTAGEEGPNDEVEIVGDDLYHWIIKLREFPHGPHDTKEETQLWRDVQQLAKKAGKLKNGEPFDFIELEILFPPDYPFAPPFIRVVKPRFAFHTGHITIGGSICKEVLTRSGWVPSYSLESLLVDIKAEMVSGGARIDFTNLRPYDISEAKEAFNRISKRYGWN